jgi:general nucleoside transport system ATP-binding protein
MRCSQGEHAPYQDPCKQTMKPVPESLLNTRLTPLCQMSGIAKSFPGVVAIRDVNFSVAAGEIRGLLGENGAGKTTLMNILYGLVRPDEGTIQIDGHPVMIRSPRDAVELGIGMVHQHFMLVPDMTVAENVALGLPSLYPPLAKIGAVAAKVAQLSERYGLQMAPGDVIEDLSVGMQQRVEILKLLYRNARVLVLDEPTSVLTPREWQHLAEVIRSLASEGRAVVFISHKLDELLAVAESCTVLRDGAVVGTVQTGQVDKPTLARMMVGREVVMRVERAPLKPGKPLLEMEDVWLEEPGEKPRLSGISFAVRSGEIFGIAGVDGNGQRELAEVLIGARSPTRGVVRLAGEPFRADDPREFRARGGAIIPEDRHRTAVMLDSSLADNLILKDHRGAPFARYGVLSIGRIRTHCERLIREYDIRAPTVDVRMRQLSGGNQQKAVLARELDCGPAVLIAAQPTRGLDVGAMEFVYRRLLEHRQAGGATLLISTELEEVLSLSDRIGVMVDGRLVCVSDSDTVDIEEIGLLMGGERAG